MPTEHGNKKLLTVTVDSDVWDSLEATRKKLRLNRSTFVNRILAGTLNADEPAYDGLATDPSKLIEKEYQEKEGEREVASR